MAGLTDEALGRLLHDAFCRIYAEPYEAKHKYLTWEELPEIDRANATDVAKAVAASVRAEQRAALEAEQQQAADLRAAVQAAIDGWSMCYARREAEQCGQCARCQLRAALAATALAGEET